MSNIYFSFAIADSMFDDDSLYDHVQYCDIERQRLTSEQVKEILATNTDYISALNPQHKPTVQALAQRFGLVVKVPCLAPIISLKLYDQVIVASVRGLPRLEENRHEYTGEEIDKASFKFSSWVVLPNRE